MKKAIAAGAAFFCASIATGSANDLGATFLIERKGDVIGYHKVSLQETDEGLRVETDIEMKVKFGFITLFRYEHDSVEIWRDGQLHSLNSRTYNAGDEAYLRIERKHDMLIIDGTAYQGPAPLNAFPSSYWSKDLIGAGALINTQNGELIDIKVHALGQTNAPNNQLADHYFINGTVGLNIWYDGDRWIGSNFTVEGEELTYILVEENRRYAALEDLFD